MFEKEESNRPLFLTGHKVSKRLVRCNSITNAINRQGSRATCAPLLQLSLVQEQSGFRREEEALHVLAGKLSIDGKRNHEEGKLNMCTNSWKTKRKRNKTKLVTWPGSLILLFPFLLIFVHAGEKGPSETWGHDSSMLHPHTDHRGTV